MAEVKQEHGSCSGVEPPRVKEEPEETELGIKPEPEEVPVHAVPVKTEDHEDDKSSVLPRILTVESIKEINPEDYSPEQPLAKVQQLTIEQPLANVQRLTIELLPPKVQQLSIELLPPKGQRLTIQLRPPKRVFPPVTNDRTATNDRITREVQRQTIELPPPNVQRPTIELPPPNVQRPTIELPPPNVQRPTIELPPPNVQRPTIELPPPNVQRPTIELPPPNVQRPTIELPPPPKAQRLTIQLRSSKRAFPPVSIATDRRPPGHTDPKPPDSGATDDGPPEYKDPRPYRCAECGRSFKKQTNLFKHVKIHERKKRPQKPQKCPVCKQSFQTRHFLNQHLYLCRIDSKQPPGDAAGPSLPYMQFVWNVLHKAQ